MILGELVAQEPAAFATSELRKKAMTSKVTRTVAATEVKLKMKTLKPKI